MSWINKDKDRKIIEEQAATIRLLTDLTKAGSWIINYAPDGSRLSKRRIRNVSGKGRISKGEESCWRKMSL